MLPCPPGQPAVAPQPDRRSFPVRIYLGSVLAPAETAIRPLRDADPLRRSVDRPHRSSARQGTPAAGHPPPAARAKRAGDGQAAQRPALGLGVIRPLSRRDGPQSRAHDSAGHATLAPVLTLAGRSPAVHGRSHLYHTSGMIFFTWRLYSAYRAPNCCVRNASSTLALCRNAISANPTAASPRSVPTARAVPSIASRM